MSHLRFCALSGNGKGFSLSRLLYFFSITSNHSMSWKVKSAVRLLFRFSTKTTTFRRYPVTRLMPLHDTVHKQLSLPFDKKWCLASGCSVQERDIFSNSASLVLSSAAWQSLEYPGQNNNTSGSSRSFSTSFLKNVRTQSLWNAVFTDTKSTCVSYKGYFNQKKYESRTYAFSEDAESARRLDNHTFNLREIRDTLLS